MFVYCLLTMFVSILNKITHLASCTYIQVLINLTVYMYMQYVHVYSTCTCWESTGNSSPVISSSGL